MKAFKLITSNYKNLFKVMWKKSPNYFFFCLMYGICIAVAAYFTIQAPRIVLDMVASQKVDTSALVQLFAGLLLFSAGAAFFKYKFTPIGYRVRYYLLKEAMKQNLYLPYDTYDDPKLLENIWVIYTPLVSSMLGIQGFFLNFGLLLGNSSIILLSSSILFVLNAWLSLFIIIWFVASIYISYHMQMKVDQIHQIYAKQEREQRYYEKVSTDFSYGKEIRVFRLKNRVVSKLRESIEAMYAAYKKDANYQYIQLVLEGIYQFIRDFTMYIILIFMFVNKDINLAQFSTYAILVSQLNLALKQSADNLRIMLSRQDSMNKMFDYLEMDKVNEDGETLEISKEWIIEFKDVTFKYPNSDRTIYENLNFTIHSGKKIAIVGLNGTGKTTLIKLLMRLYEPTQGEILLNGVNIQKYKLDDYLSLFAPLFQEMNTYAASIKENLAFDLEFDLNKAKESLKKALIFDRLNEIDNFYEQEMTRYLSDDGILLSGGETQKFMMARALYYDRSIMILDEPTSALDAVAEYDFYRNISETSKDKTILFISHRLASTSFCDETILIEEKNIKESGTHEMLMKLEKRYYELFQIQAKYYQEGGVCDEE